jgi:hypothetical protein
MNAIRLIAALGALAMLAAIGYAFAVGDFGREGGVILEMPWGVVSLVDLYVGLVLFSAWILFREGLTARSLVWVVLMFVLGNLTAAVYVLFALQGSRGDWQRFFLGVRQP